MQGPESRVCVGKRRVGNPARAKEPMQNASGRTTPAREDVTRRIYLAQPDLQSRYMWLSAHSSAKRLTTQEPKFKVSPSRREPKALRRSRRIHQGGARR